MHIPSNYWIDFLPYYSASFTQDYLRKKYRMLGIPEAETKSYDNCYPFMYYLEHGQTYFSQALSSPVSIQPVSVFYGFVQLLKACILSMNPNYPDSVSVLAHGVTSRKRKKQHYSFMEDEVKVQRNGLFPFLAESMFHMKHLEQEKYAMHDLLGEIPEMHQLMKRKQAIPLAPVPGGYEMSNAVLDHFQMTAARLEGFLMGRLRQPSLKLTAADSLIKIKTERPFSCNQSSPVHYHLYKADYWMSLNRQTSCYEFPELMVHYLLLYNLSMICRYETEWWMDLQKTAPTDDYPFIIQYLRISADKIPFLIGQWLAEQPEVFI